MLVALVMLLGCEKSAVYADVFHLKEGGKLEGKLLGRDGERNYVIMTKLGAQVTLSRKQVERVDRLSEVDKEYAKRSRTIPDTVEAHRELAQWCKENSRSKLAEHHYQRILEIDPTDEQARQKLGYQKFKGDWMTREEIMQNRGLQFFKGKYRTPQDIFLLQQEDKLESAEADWIKKLRLWRGWLNNSRRFDEAVENISQIDDPHATAAIVKMLEREEDQEIRDLLIATLAELDHPLAVVKLVEYSLEDPLQEVRMQCIDYLLARGEPISLTPYVNALTPRRNSNEIINRAAEALHELGDPNAISPLIDALVTTHKYKNGEAPPGDYNVTFGKNGGNAFGGGGGGLSLGGKSKVISIDHNNLDVRRALVELSGGMDFEFDKTAWRRWYINEQIQEFVDTRRDQ